MFRRQLVSLLVPGLVAALSSMLLAPTARAQTAGHTIAAPAVAILETVAPSMATAVEVKLPFGPGLALRRDGSGGAWRARLELPAQVDDGIYEARYVVALGDGRVLHSREAVELKRGGPAFHTWFRGDQVVAGDTVELVVDAVEPARRVEVDCAALGWRRERLEPVDGQAHIHWGGLLALSPRTGPGEYEVQVTVLDGSRRLLSSAFLIVAEP